MWVWTCNGTRGQANVFGTTSNQYPTCSSGQGAWVELDLTPWYAQVIPAEQVTSLFTALFLFAAVITVLVLVDKALDR